MWCRGDGVTAAASGGILLRIIRGSARTDGNLDAERGGILCDEGIALNFLCNFDGSHGGRRARLIVDYCFSEMKSF